MPVRIRRIHPFATHLATAPFLLAAAAGSSGCGSSAASSAGTEAGSGDALPSSDDASTSDSSSQPTDSPSGGGHDAATGDAAHSGSDGGIDLGALHRACPSGPCPAGLTAVSYTGFAGPSGPTFCSCEIPCAADASACPPGTTCGYIADGPGYVCSN